MSAPDGWAGDRPALLVMDVQRGLVDVLGAAPLVNRLRSCADAARAHDVPVVYVGVGFRPGHPEVHPRNVGFVGAAASGLFDEDGPGVDLHPGLGVQPRDAVVRKRRVSAFYGTELDVLLGSLGVGHVVLTGLSTTGVVLSTFRDAGDRDYAITVLSDGCADGDTELHALLVSRLFPAQGQVMTCDEWIGALADAPHAQGPGIGSP